MSESLSPGVYVIEVDPRAELAGSGRAAAPGWLLELLDASFGRSGATLPDWMADGGADTGAMLLQWAAELAQAAAEHARSRPGGGDPRWVALAASLLQSAAQPDAAPSHRCFYAKLMPRRTVTRDVEPHPPSPAMH